MTIQVKVITNASKNEVISFCDDVLKVKITTIAQKNKANKFLYKFLASKLGVAKKDINILKGLKSSLKTIQINGIDKKILNNFNANKN